jgi:nucleotide-binding universal stress UspA family protein
MRSMRAWSRVVVGYEASEPGRDALVLGELLARTVGGELLAARVEVDGEHAEAEAKGELSGELSAALAGSPVRFRDLATRGRSPWHTLLELAEGDRRVGLIVLGSTHRSGIGRVLPGGTAERLLAGAPTAVAVAPRGYAASAAADGARLADDLRVLAVGFDRRPESEAAITLAAEVALAAGATLRVIAVGAHGPANPDLEQDAASATAGPDLQQALHDAVAALPDELRALPIYERGDPARVILELAEVGVDLLVMGSRGRGPVGSVLLGSTASAVIASSPCPVVVVPRPALATQR